jgi:hypothetical protein
VNCYERQEGVRVVQDIFQFPFWEDSPSIYRNEEDEKNMFPESTMNSFLIYLNLRN